MSQGINGRNCARLGEEMGCVPFILHHSFVAVAAATRIRLVPQADFSFRLIDAHLIATGAGAATFVFYNSTSATVGAGTAINAAADLTNVGDGDLIRLGPAAGATIDDAAYNILKGQGLAVDTGAAQADCELYVMCVRI